MVNKRKKIQKIFVDMVSFMPTGFLLDLPKRKWLSLVISFFSPSLKR